MFSWMDKPRLLMTGWDELRMAIEITLVVIVGVLIFGWFDHRRRARIKKSHGPHCTCWTCMGVR